MKKILVIFLVALSVLACTGCESKEKEVKYIAYVNRFGDIKRYELTGSEAFSSGIVKLKLKDGSTMYVGVNNVIIEKK